MSIGAREKHNRSLEKAKKSADSRSCRPSGILLDNPTTLSHKNNEGLSSRQLFSLWLALFLLFQASCTAVEPSRQNIDNFNNCSPAFISYAQECLDQMLEVQPSPNQDEQINRILSMRNPVVIGMVSAGAILEPSPFGEVAVMLMIAGGYLVITDGNSNINDIVNYFSSHGVALQTINSMILPRLINNPFAMALAYAYVVTPEGDVFIGAQPAMPSGEGVGVDSQVITPEDIRKGFGSNPDLVINSISEQNGQLLVDISLPPEVEAWVDIYDVLSSIQIKIEQSGDSVLLSELINKGKIVLIGGPFNADMEDKSLAIHYWLHRNGMRVEIDQFYTSHQVTIPNGQKVELGVPDGEALKQLFVEYPHLKDTPTEYKYEQRYPATPEAIDNYLNSVRVAEEAIIKAITQIDADPNVHSDVKHVIRNIMTIYFPGSGLGLFVTPSSDLDIIIKMADGVRYEEASISLEVLKELIRKNLPNDYPIKKIQLIGVRSNNSSLGLHSISR